MEIIGESTSKCEKCDSNLIFVLEKERKLFGFIPVFGKEKWIRCPKNISHYHEEIDDEPFDRHG